MQKILVEYHFEQNDRFKAEVYDADLHAEQDLAEFVKRIKVCGGMIEFPWDSSTEFTIAPRTYINIYVLLMESLVGSV